MFEEIIPSPDESLKEISGDSKLYKETQDFGRKKYPEFYEGYDGINNWISSLKEIGGVESELVILREAFENAKIMEQILMTGTSESLDKITSFTDIEALKMLIVNYRGDDLYLSGLKTLNDEEAFILSNFKGKYLYLEGLINISDEVLKYLISYNGNMLVFGENLEVTDNQLSIIADSKNAHIDISKLKG